MYYKNDYENDIMNDTIDDIITEAVFNNGKETVYPLLKFIQAIKDELNFQIKEHEDSIKYKNDNKDNTNKDDTIKIKEFDPKKFWKNTIFKDLEDCIKDIFGFRNVEINPYIEKYISSKKRFESCELNCVVYHVDRFPIEGLITERGFYDKSHSLNMQLYISLGLIKNLEAEEILAVFLHEFGHSIDPALTDIKYTQTNILSKYITDRKKSINKNENRVMNKFGIFKIFGIGVIVSILIILAISITKSISNIFTPKNKIKNKTIEKKLDKIKQKIKNDKEKFNRQNYSEAYADNFSRMYGYGHILMNALKKISNDMDRELRSRVKKESIRQEIIYKITMSLIDDCHKTDIHRIRNLINEYKIDINDPSTPPIVKKQLEEDLLELEKVLDQYLNHKDEFQKRVNNLINDELKKLEDEDDKKSNKDKEEKKEIKESFELFDESKKIKKPLTTEEYDQVHKRFGEHLACSFAKDNKGYYCYTHRCRSKSYESIDDIPMDKFKFVCSTS